MPSKNSLTSIKSVNNKQEPILTPGENEKGDNEADKQEKGGGGNKAAAKIKKKSKRINKGFQIDAERGRKWDILVAQMKASSPNKKNTGPDLMAEAMDYVFDKYLNNQIIK